MTSSALTSYDDTYDNAITRHDREGTEYLRDNPPPSFIQEFTSSIKALFYPKKRSKPEMEDDCETYYKTSDDDVDAIYRQCSKAKPTDAYDAFGRGRNRVPSMTRAERYLPKIIRKCFAKKG